MEKFSQITGAARAAVTELVEVSGLKSGDIFVVGCSTSEVGGDKIGTCSNEEIAQALLAGILPPLAEKGIFLAAQCCEHLNRAIIIPREAAEKFGLEIVSVVPVKKAGGSFATACFAEFNDPVAVETLENKAAAGIDIGGTLIGMHLKPVAVPVRLATTEIGSARLICARTRPKYIGGSRAHYQRDAGPKSR